MFWRWQSLQLLPYSEGAMETREIILPRPAPNEYSPIFEAEIALVPDGTAFCGLLAAQLEETRSLITSLGEDAAGLRYAPGKWTVRETVGHLADCERVLSYRMLRFLRGDATVLSGFDHNAYVPAGQFEARSLASVFEEFRAVRGATIALIDSTPAEAFERGGVVGSSRITARALAYLIAGHERHHQELLRTHYLPALLEREGGSQRR